MSAVDAFGPNVAGKYVREMVEIESRGHGDQMNALDRIGRQCGVSPRALRRLLSGETKDPSFSVVARLHSAYVKLCERQIARLDHQLHEAKARFGDAPFEGIEAKVAALGEELRREKERLQA